MTTSKTNTKGTLITELPPFPVMKQVRLTGITRKGKTRIGNSGDVWNIVEGAVEALTPAPNGSLFLRSLDGRDARWVEITNDPNFTVEFL